MQKMVQTMVAVVVLAAGPACDQWTLNNPDDPLRCATPCNAGEVCQQGLCIPTPYCGDNAINGDKEECDGQAFAGATCISKGFVAGSLLCSNECKVDSSGCSAHRSLVVDPPLTIAGGGQNETEAVFACGDRNCLAVWREEVSNGTWGIFGMRVSFDGKKLDDSKISIATGATNKTWPTISSAGNEYWLTWEQGEGANLGVYTLRLADTGMPVDATPLQVITTPPPQTGTIESVCNKDQCLLAWLGSLSDVWSVHAARFDLTTNVLAEAVTVTEKLCVGADCVNSLDVAAAKTQFWVVWSTGNTDIRGARISFAGELLDQTSIEVSGAEGRQRFPKIGCVEDSCWAVWRDERTPNLEVFGTRIDSAGVVLDANGIAISTDKAEQYSIGIACGANDCLVSWLNDLGQTKLHSSKHAVRVDMTGEVIDDPAVEVRAFSAGSSENFGLAYPAYDGRQYWLVWQEYDDTKGWDVLGARLVP